MTPRPCVERTVRDIARLDQLHFPDVVKEKIYAPLLQRLVLPLLQNLHFLHSKQKDLKLDGNLALDGGTSYVCLPAVYRGMTESP